MASGDFFGGFLRGVTNTTLHLRQLQQAHEREKTDNELKRKELKLREQRAEFDAQLMSQKLQEFTSQRQGRQALGELFGAGMRQPEAFPGGFQPVAEGTPLISGVTPTAGVDPQAAIQEQIRGTRATQLNQAVTAGEQAIQQGMDPGAVQKLLQARFPELAQGEAGEFTLKPGEVRFRGGKPIATVPKEGAPPSQLVQAILREPQLFEKLPADTRAAITPALVEGGFRGKDLTTPEDVAMQGLRRQKLQLDVQTAQREATGGLTGGDQRTLQLATRAAIRQEPAFKDFQAARSGYNAVIVGAQQANAAGDLAMINGIARLLDPGSVVRPSEFETVRQAQGLIDQIQIIVKRLETGESMAPKTRERVTKLAHALITEWGQAVKAEVEPIYRSVLKGTKISLEDVFVEPSSTLPQGAPLSEADLLEKYKK